MNGLSITLLPVLPGWLIALVAVSLLGLLGLGCRMLVNKNVPHRWVVLLGGLRLVIVAVFVLCLLQPVASFSRTIKPLPEMLVMVDTSQSMGLPGGAGAATRLDEVRKNLKTGELASALSDRFHLRWFAFDQRAYPATTAGLDDLQPTGETTHFADSLTAAWNQFRYADPAEGATTGTPPRVLLVSDGNDLGSTDVVETARRLGTVVDTLAPTAAQSTAGTTEPVVADVQCARRILIGSETRFLVTLRSTRSSRREATLYLLEDGKEVKKQDIAFEADQDELHVAVVHRPTDAGWKRYEFVTMPKGHALPDPPEGRPYAVNVRVLGEKHEVLLLEDSWRWSFKFLRRIFEDDPSFNFTALVSRGGNAFATFGEPERRVNLGGFPQSRTELDWFDTIILGDVNPTRWPKGLTSALSRSIRDDGKSLIVIAGPNLSHFVDFPELHMLLPVELTTNSGSPLEGPIDVQISAEGSRSPFFFQAAGANAAEMSTDLPALDQIYPVQRKRPAATVLLEAVRQSNDYGRMIVMAEHTVGKGRVLFIGTDTLWKWQMLGPQNESNVTLYQLVWQQALRAMAPTRPDSSGAHLWLQPDRSRYATGRCVQIRAEIEAEQNAGPLKVQATVVLPDGRQVPLGFTADAVSPHTFNADFETSLPGQYRITASAQTGSKAVAEGSTAIEVDQSQSELSSRDVDGSRLAHISQATGGNVINPSDPHTWPTPPQTAARVITQRRSLDLWNNFSLMLVLSALLGTDWMLRLVRGYV